MRFGRRPFWHNQPHLCPTYITPLQARPEYGASLGERKSLACESSKSSVCSGAIASPFLRPSSSSRVKHICDLFAFVIPGLSFSILFPLSDEQRTLAHTHRITRKRNRDDF